MRKPLVILVTGATAGIGKATALHLRARGHRVIGAGRNARALAELATAGVDAVTLDVTSAASIEAAVAEVDRLTGGYGVDVLVNNAGFAQYGPLEMLEDADVRAQFDTNVFGLLAVTRAFLPKMRARRSGRIVNVSSIGARMVFPFGGAYHAAKHAVDALSTTLRLELAPAGIRVSTIEPGYIKTDFMATTVTHVEKYARDASSPYAAVLQQLVAKVGDFDRYAAPPDAVVRAIESAAVSRFPRARYIAPRPSALGPLVFRLIPTFLMDRLLRRAVGLTGQTAVPAPPRLPPAAPADEERG